VILSKIPPYFFEDTPSFRGPPVRALRLHPTPLTISLAHTSRTRNSDTLFFSLIFLPFLFRFGLRFSRVCHLICAFALVRPPHAGAVRPIPGRCSVERTVHYHFLQCHWSFPSGLESVAIVNIVPHFDHQQSPHPRAPALLFSSPSEFGTDSLFCNFHISSESHRSFPPPYYRVFSVARPFERARYIRLFY